MIAQFPALPLQPDQKLPALGQAALLLDLDGTLLDIAPAPDLVVVPSHLPRDLLRARRAVGDALAIISGRPLDQVDTLLPGVPYAIAGEHGSVIRHAPQAVKESVKLPSVPQTWLQTAENLAATTPCVLLERKQHGFVLHYRAAAAAGPMIEAALRGLLANNADFTLLSALMAWEVRPVGADKATAVDALMRRTPFAGRLPIFIGDDVTDEDGMRASRAHGGIGLHVADAFGSASAVRDWLARINAG